jgi:hypothetical protein
VRWARFPRVTELLEDPVLHDARDPASLAAGSGRTIRPIDVIELSVSGPLHPALERVSPRATTWIHDVGVGVGARVWEAED